MAKAQTTKPKAESKQSKAQNTPRLKQVYNETIRKALQEQFGYDNEMQVPRIDKIVAGEAVDVKPGNAMPLASMPVGTIVHNIELKPGKGGQVARSAGGYAQLVGRDQGMAILRLNSGEQRIVHGSCMATVGAVSNPDHGNINDGKAGRTVWRGKRPHNRGVAMNPVDHPHGGGEGRTSGGRHPVSPWGKPTKGKKTRSNKATDKFIVRSRHQRKS